MNTSVTAPIATESTAPASLASIAAQHGLKEADLVSAVQWAKAYKDARSNSGRIKATLAQVGESSLRLAGKKTTLIEGTAYDTSALPDADIETLSNAVRIIKAVETLSKAATPVKAKAGKTSSRKGK